MANLLLNEKQLNDKENNFYSEEKNIEQNNPDYYSVIPANVRYDDELCPNAKLLYSEITALCNKEGYCWASNSYFASLYQKNERTVSRWINQLIKKGYIFSISKYKEATKKIEKRFLSLSPLKDKIVQGYRQKCQGGIDKNVQENNTSINNKNIINTSINNNNNIFKEKENNKRKRKETFSLGELELEFEKIWNEYPRKEKKVLAKKYFFKKIKSGIKLEVIFEGLKKYKQFWTETKIEQKYIPHLSNWLNGERWNDECVQKCELNNTSYDISEYEENMDTFASTDESNLIDDFNPADEIRKRQKQVDPSFEKFKKDIKKAAIEEFGPRLGDKILQIKDREEFFETVNTLRDMIKRKYYVWFNGDLVCAADIEKQKIIENERREKCCCP